MARTPAACIAIAAAALAAGCFEGKADITLNPDGAGKIVGEITFLPTTRWAGRSSSDPDLKLNDPETQMKEIVRKFLKSTRGVEAWKDVSFKRLADGRIQLKGTAYFEDISKVKIHPDDAKSRAAFGPEGKNALLLVLHRPTQAATTSRRRFTSESLAARMKDMRRDFREARGPIGLELADMELDLRFRLPGVVGEAKGLEQAGRILTFSTTGAQLIRHIESLVADNNALRNMAMAGQSLGGRSLAKLISSTAISQRGEVWARMTGHFRPQFNYEDEAKAAEDLEDEMRVKLGLEEEKASRSPPSSSKRSSTKTKSAPKKRTPKKDDTTVPKLPIPNRPPSIPTPILPF